MHEQFFGLKERPFPAAPLAEAFVPVEAAEHARRQLERCIERGEGVGLLIGSAGTGKTQLLQVLARRFRDTLHVARLTGAALCTRRALLQSILYELNLPYRGLEEGELRLSLIDHLRPTRECPHGMLLLLDEAHALPLRLLEEVRLITNLCDQGTPRVRLVMAGTMAFEERLASPKLAAFNQRVAARCYLHSMNARETQEYVRQQLQRAGAGKQSIFTESALRAIHTATDGIPRLVNQLCDHALLLAAAGGQRSIDAAGIQEAWSDLQQLPAPWTEPSHATPSTIEFGALDEPAIASFDDSPSAPANAPADDEFTPADQHLHDPVIEIEQRLEELEQQLAGANEDVISVLQDDSCSPAPAVGEMKISIRDLNRIFGEGFDEEEVVIDRFAALDTMALPHRLQVSTREGLLFTTEVVLLPQDSEPVDPRPQWKVVSAADPVDEAEVVTVAEAFCDQPEVFEVEPRPERSLMIDGLSDEAPVTIAYRPSEEPTGDEFDPVYPEPDLTASMAASREGMRELRCEEPASVPRPNTLADLIRKRRPTFQKLFASLRQSK